MLTAIMSRVAAAFEADPALSHLAVTKAPMWSKPGQFHDDSFWVVPPKVIPAKNDPTAPRGYRCDIDRTTFTFKEKSFTAWLCHYNGPTLPVRFDSEEQAVAEVLEMVRTIFVDRCYPMDPKDVCPLESIHLPDYDDEEVGWSNPRWSWWQDENPDFDI